MPQESRSESTMRTGAGPGPPNFREFVFRDCLKSPDNPKTKALEGYETGQKGLISLRCANDIYTWDTTERLFRQSLCSTLSIW